MSELILWCDALYDSPWVHSAWVALKEKGLSFKTVAVDLASGAHRRSELARRTLATKVPTLQHGDLWLGESSAIAEYLEEAYPAPAYPALLPDDLVGRARDRELRSWLRTTMTELRRCMPYERIFVAGESPAITPQARSEAEALLRVAEGRWSAGAPERPSLADLELSMMVRRPIHHGISVTGSLREAADALWWRPACASFVELPRPAA
jgi:glutathione S-transferase